MNKQILSLAKYILINVQRTSNSSCSILLNRWKKIFFLNFTLIFRCSSQNKEFLWENKKKFLICLDVFKIVSFFSNLSEILNCLVILGENVKMSKFDLLSSWLYIICMIMEIKSCQMMFVCLGLWIKSWFYNNSNI